MALTIRERFNEGRSVGAVGTRNRPLPLDLALDGGEPASQRLPIRLGYEGIPSTQFLSFSLPRPAMLRARRLGADPYLLHVALSLVGPGTERSGRPLVQTVDGDSGWTAIDAGDWMISVAVGIPIEISLEIEISLAPLIHQLTGEVRPLLEPRQRIGRDGGILWADIETPSPSSRPAIGRPGPRTRRPIQPRGLPSIAMATMR